MYMPSPADVADEGRTGVKCDTLSKGDKSVKRAHETILWVSIVGKKCNATYDTYRRSGQR